MKSKKIEQAEKDLHEIEEELSPELRFEPMKEWTKKYGVHHSSPPSYSQPGKMVEWIDDSLENAHRFLQTEMMLNAHISVKQSYKWAAIAAIAAIVASIGVIASWLVFLHKMIFQILKGILNIF